MLGQAEFQWVFIEVMLLHARPLQYIRYAWPGFRFAHRQADSLLAARIKEVDPMKLGVVLTHSISVVQCHAGHY